MIEGVVLAPSAFSITFGFPFSITETQEFVVPRSIPIIFDILVISLKYLLTFKLGQIIYFQAHIIYLAFETVTKAGLNTLSLSL